MTNRHKALLTAAALLAGLAAAPALARDNAPMGTTITKADLEKDGYTCQLVSVGFWECTKGGKTYWCDAGSCQPKPRLQPSGTRVPRPDVNGQLLSR
ncbi:hypothetical protein [Devosia sp.]|uniref:hypothetical protein n=1 Tax=Devosia sp. TaxID=1871048 RepID=UPI002F13AB1C